MFELLQNITNNRIYITDKLIFWCINLQIIHKWHYVNREFSPDMNLTTNGAVGVALPQNKQISINTICGIWILARTFTEAARSHSPLLVSLTPAKQNNVYFLFTTFLHCWTTLAKTEYDMQKSLLKLKNSEI